MSTGPLPRQADIRKLTSSGAVLEGKIKVSKLDRLRQALADDSGELTYSLAFGRDEEGTIVIEGNISAQVMLPCQRCLDAMEFSLASEFRLGVAYSDEKAKHLPDSLEPLVVEGETADLQVVVEDEALLCVPIVSYHPEADCKVKAGYESVGEEIAEPVEEEKENPFKVLEALKKSES